MQTVRTALWFHYEPWSTCCTSCPASCGGNMGCIICSFQNVISCRFGGSHSSDRTALPRLVCLHQELALCSFSSAAELVSWLCAALGPCPTLWSRCTAAGLLSQPPAAAQAPGTQGRKKAAGFCCCLCRTFPDTRCSAQSSYLRLASDWKLFSLKDSAWGSWKGQRKYQKDWTRSLTM